MPGFLLHAGATVMCSHGGQAQPTVINPRVTVSGQPTVLQPGPYAIGGCGLAPTGVPCVTATFVTAALRVTSNGQPLLLSDSQAVCAPTGMPLAIVITQVRVNAM